MELLISKLIKERIMIVLRHVIKFDSSHQTSKGKQTLYIVSRI